MKLSEIRPLMESVKPVVYKISSNEAVHVYYGYTAAASEAEVRKIFYTTAKAVMRKADRQDRGAGKWLAEHIQGGGKIIPAIEMVDGTPVKTVKGFTVEFVGEPPSLEEAFISRNDWRKDDDMAITGPTVYPTDMWNKVKSTNPDKIEEWRAEAKRRREEEEAGMTDEQREVRKEKFKIAAQKSAATRQRKADELAQRKEEEKPPMFRRGAFTTIRPFFDEPDTK